MLDSNRLKPTDAPQGLQRNDRIMWQLPMDGRGLEIGPSYAPVAPKRAGYKVETLDHTDAETLRAKYAAHGIDTKNIEDVDYVWTGQPLQELTGKLDHYDWIIASHVIEHTPDFVAFLQSCQAMLKPGGRLSLVVPDRRYCFDICRPVSTPGEILQGHFERRTKHTLGVVWDHFSLAMKRGNDVSWARQTKGEDTLIYPDIGEAKRQMDLARSGEYVDVHNWRFTPTSFYLVMQDLWTLNLTQLDLCTFFEHEGCEFFIQLEKRSGGMRTEVDRLQLIRAAFKESADLIS